MMQLTQQLASLPQDLAPNYSGTLTGVSNTLATLPGFLVPQVTGYLITDQVRAQK